jgi:proteasome accessory factor A
LGQTSAEAGFQIAQRADFFEAITGLETTIRRPLLNTRDEPHADPARWRRLHVIAGDANRSHTSTLLKLGTAAAVLSAIDAGVLRPVRLADPLAAVRTVSRDLNCTARLALSGGGSMTALQIQVDYRAQLQAAGLGDPEVMQLWGDALDGLGRDPLSWLALDWVSKLNLIQSFRRRDALDWDHPRIAQLDLAYAELAERSPFSALVRAGRMPVLVSDGEVRRAVAEPPSDTRAYLRGRLVGERTSEVNAVDWSYVVMTDRRGRRRIDLDDPLTGSGQDVRDRGGLHEYRGMAV